MKDLTIYEILKLMLKGKPNEDFELDVKFASEIIISCKIQITDIIDLNPGGKLNED